MKQIVPEKLRSLKANQQWTCFSGILELQRQIYRYIGHLACPAQKNDLANDLLGMTK